MHMGVTYKPTKLSGHQDPSVSAIKVMATFVIFHRPPTCSLEISKQPRWNIYFYTEWTEKKSKKARRILDIRRVMRLETAFFVKLTLFSGQIFALLSRLNFLAYAFGFMTLFFDVHMWHSIFVYPSREPSCHRNVEIWDHPNFDATPERSRMGRWSIENANLATHYWYIPLDFHV